MKNAFQAIARFIREMLTGDDNHTYEQAYVLTIFGFLAGIALEVYSVYAGRTFNLTDYGLGLSSMVAAMKGAVWIGNQSVNPPTNQPKE